MKYKSRKRKFPKKINFFLYLVSLISRFFGKKRGAICFVTHPNKPWGCNLEALLCFAIRDDRVKKIYLLNFGDIPTETLCNEIADPQNKVSIIDPRDFFDTLRCITSSSLFFVGDYSNYRLPGTVVNLWHGIPMKKIGTFQDKKHKRLGRQFSKVLSAQSPFDHHNMSLAFNKDPSEIIAAGLPRHDWIYGSLQKPKRYREAVLNLERVLNGRGLVLYAPTFRDEDRNKLPISEKDLEIWADWLAERNFALGLRAHVVAHAQQTYTNPNIISLSGAEYNHVEALFEFTDILVTDYSSLCLDFMITDKPIIGLDLNKTGYSRGFLLDFDLLFPGEFHHSLNELFASLEAILSCEATQADYGLKKDMFLGAYKGDSCANVFKSLL
jgi:CDP-glycerol glycerophosphotransferase (TagB/SpsB family)